MRRIVIAATLLLALLCAGTASAQALNSYGATMSYDQYAAGTATVPVGLGFSESLGVSSATAGTSISPVTDIQTLLPQANFAFYRHFPACSAAKISAAGGDTVCPPGSLLGTGSFTSQLLQPDYGAAYRTCNPDLDIYNGGSARVVFFMTLPPRHQCDGFRTGTIKPWTGHLSEHGGELVLDMPLPTAISTDVGGGLWSSLQAFGMTLLKTAVSADVPTVVTEHVKVKVKVKKKVHGKTRTVTETKTRTKHVTRNEVRNVAFFQSTGCTGGQRPFTLRVTATNGAENVVTDAPGSAPC